MGYYSAHITIDELASMSIKDLTLAREALLEPLEQGTLIPREELRLLGKIEAELVYRGEHLRPQQPHPRLWEIVAKNVAVVVARAERRRERRWRVAYYERHSS